jgi:oligopeptide/dipeptide ABC transporter ATP-binding protein
MPPSSAEPLVSLRDLSLSFPGRAGRTRVIDRVSLDIRPDEILGLVGESGSGKSVTSMAIMGLTRAPGAIDGGEIWHGGQNLLALGEAELRQLRGRSIAMIFQNPRSALNPLTRVGEQLARVFRLHRGLNREQAQAAAVQMLREVDIKDPVRLLRSYPHQLSGGMCQRLMIALMIAAEPRLLIADEPTTSLDVTIQAQIFELIKRLQARTGLSVLLITHDLGVVAETCHRVAVMHAGHIVEVADVGVIFRAGRHPYTQRLLGSVLRVDRKLERPAALPVMAEEIQFSSFACRYANKCSLAEAICRQARPPLVEAGAGHWVMCHKVQTNHDSAAQG